MLSSTKMREFLLFPGKRKQTPLGSTGRWPVGLGCQPKRASLQDRDHGYTLIMTDGCSSWLGFAHHVLHVCRGRTISINLLHRAVFNRANFFHGLLRADIVFSDKEHNVLDKLERVIQQ